MGLWDVWWLAWALSFFIPKESQELSITHSTPKTGLLKQTGITAPPVQAWGLHVASGRCLWVQAHCVIYSRKGRIASEPNPKAIPWIFHVPSPRKTKCSLFWLAIPCKFFFRHETNPASCVLGCNHRGVWLQHIWTYLHELHSGQHSKNNGVERVLRWATHAPIPGHKLDGTNGIKSMLPYVTATIAPTS